MNGGRSSRASRTLLAAYWSVVVLFLLLFGWWMFFFAQQGELLVERITEAGVQLEEEEAAAVRVAADQSLRMLMFEGSFIGLLLLAGVVLVLRSVRQEVRLYHQQRDLVSAVTHELRSPIASARLYIESLLLGRVPDGKQERYLLHAKQDLDRLNAMVERLLASARITKGGPSLTLERLDLSEYVPRAVERLVGQEAGEEELDTSVQVGGRVLVEADATALDTILRNLIVNTLKYGGSEPRLSVEVREAEGRALLKVRDYGPGVHGIDLGEVFEPFTRGGDEQERARPGIGLGLFLVSELARALNGKIRAWNDREEGGFALEISLPLVPAEVSG